VTKSPHINPLSTSSVRSPRWLRVCAQLPYPTYSAPWNTATLSTGVVTQAGDTARTRGTCAPPALKPPHSDAARPLLAPSDREISLHHSFPPANPLRCFHAHSFLFLASDFSSYPPFQHTRHTTYMYTNMRSFLYTLFTISALEPFVAAHMEMIKRGLARCFLALVPQNLTIYTN
jgi:hypothetical protein